MPGRGGGSRGGGGGLGPVLGVSSLECVCVPGNRLISGACGLQGRPERSQRDTQASRLGQWPPKDTAVFVAACSCRVSWSPKPPAPPLGQQCGTRVGNASRDILWPQPACLELLMGTKRAPPPPRHECRPPRQGASGFATPLHQNQTSGLRFFGPRGLTVWVSIILAQTPGKVLTAWNFLICQIRVRKPTLQGCSKGERGVLGLPLWG